MYLLSRVLLVVAALMSTAVVADTSSATNELVIAIMSDKEDAALEALKNGADVNADTGEGRTPLIVAVMSTHPLMVKLLLEHGADPKRQADDPAIGNATTAAFFAMNGMQLTGRSDERDPARHAAALEVLRLVAAQKAELNLLVRRATTQMSALMLAAQAGARDAVQVLLEAGADPNVANGGKYTALDYAVDRAPVWTQANAEDRAAIVKALLAAGANRDHKGADGLTPLERARRSGNANLASLL